MRLPVDFIVLALTASQNISVPKSWRKPQNYHSRAERIRTSEGAINEIMLKLDSEFGEFDGIGFWQSGNVWSAIANHDHLSGTKTYHASVVKNINTVFKRHHNFDPYGWWAQAAIYGYRVYHDKDLLSHATATWNHVTKYVITPSDVQASELSGKVFSVAHQCQGKSMVGGVFWRPTPDDKSVNSITTGLYLTLSASLAEITGDKKYIKAAIASAEWIEAHNLNSKNLVLDSVNGHNCSKSPATWMFTYNSGKFIEGLAILEDFTKDSRWKELMVKVVEASVKTASWQGKDGIITEGVSKKNNDGVGFKAIFVRALYEAYAKNHTDKRLRFLLRSYINVQYNALLDLAKGGNHYSVNWHGPPQKFTTWGQLAALDVLVSAIKVN